MNIENVSNEEKGNGVLADVSGSLFVKPKFKN
jgi:prefoldin subunit 5